MEKKHEQMAGSPTLSASVKNQAMVEATSYNHKDAPLKAMENVMSEDAVTPAHLEAVTTFNPYEIRCTETVRVSAEKL